MEVHLRNESVTAGVALHWHGVDVPNAMDGVAGVTQDAVPVGGEFTYRFVAEQRGTYWYHSHQVSNEQVVGGLFGALIIEPKKAEAEQPSTCSRSPTSTAGSRRSTASAEDYRVPAPPGRTVRRPGDQHRQRADRGLGRPARTGCWRWTGTTSTSPTDVSDESITLTAGGRVDLGVTMPADGSRDAGPGVEGDGGHPG